MNGEMAVASIIPNLGDYAPIQRISVPVRPIFLTNMVFKHIIGVPARSDEESTPSYKLQLLDSLIERLTRLDRSLAPQAENLKKNGPIGERLAAAGELLRTAVFAQKPFSAGLLPSPGLLVNRLA